MKILILVAYLMSSRAFAIAGGTPAKPGEFPSIVLIRMPLIGQFCAGTLITKSWVLTAGHCLNHPFTQVITGLNSGDAKIPAETFSVSRFVRYPLYNQALEHSYDIGLIKIAGLSKSPPSKLLAQRLQLPREGRLNATIAGWGATHGFDFDLEDVLLSQKPLLRADVPIVADARCEAVYPGRLDESMVCAGFEQGGVDSCSRDSGGPLLVHSFKGVPLLAGLVSWGDGCAAPHQFGVYARVDRILDWIRETIQSH